MKVHKSFLCALKRPNQSMLLKNASLAVVSSMICMNGAMANDADDDNVVDNYSYHSYFYKELAKENKLELQESDIADDAVAGFDDATATAEASAERATAANTAPSASAANAGVNATAASYGASHANAAQDMGDNSAYITSTGAPRKEEAEQAAFASSGGNAGSTMMSATGNSLPANTTAASGSANAVGDESVLNHRPQYEASVLRLREDAPAVSWVQVGHAEDRGGLHGNVAMQIEIDDIHRYRHQDSSGKFKFGNIQAFLRHDELPNWYFGFWSGREDNYKGDFFYENYTGSNNINEFFIGHIFDTYHGQVGTEFLMGSESGPRRWKNRIKIWQNLRLTDRFSITGYEHIEYQPRNSDPYNGDLDQYIFEAEPSFQYRIGMDWGLYFRTFYNRNTVKRLTFPNINEYEYKLYGGVYKNWGTLLTSFYAGVGRNKKSLASGDDPVLYDAKYKMIGTTFTYPFYGGFNVYGELRARFIDESGNDVVEGNSWNSYSLVGVSYNF